ncbi:COP9 signalosome [Flammula alnicola]|nr:COP9 signalosome [Flammula alnicola]
MVNGPPTPPATTPAELQDEARTTSSVADSSTSLPLQNDPQIRPEVYQSVMPAIAEAIARKDYKRLVRVAEEADFNTANDRQQPRMLIVAPLVLGHLVNDDLAPARYALLRLPDSLASLLLPRALTTLVTSTMNRQHVKVYEQAANLLGLVSQPDFFDKDLASIIATLISAFLDSFRQRTFELLSKAYTSLLLPLACTYLGLQTEQIITVAEKYGWSYDPSTQILCPARPAPFGRSTSSSKILRHYFEPPHINEKMPDFSSLETFHFVTDSVAGLES